MREGPNVNAAGTAIRPRTDLASPGGLDELELLERVRARDVDAFERLYRIYQPRLARFLINLLKRPQLVEEVLDDTMMVVWQTAGSFRGTSKLSTWVFAIAYRKALKARSRWPDPIEDDGHDTRASNDPAPDEELERSRIRNALVSAMAKLSAEQRAVVDLTYFHELGYRDIAEILSCPVDTVKTRMFHARRRLRQTLSGTLADWL
ncbi:MAG TPA: sigma-70 family RNA polymerase sigma factor [Sphingomicrobium sp.]|jgi:RNA polymerase sigma-70 factor (ECF subfamily)|nr:sigma-70 family RNA polymerase sigma factor [Sphingomicrobium sp.]